MPHPERAPNVAELKAFVREALAGESVRRMRVAKFLFLEARPSAQAAYWVLRFSIAGRKASKGYGRFPGVGLAEASEAATADRLLLNQGINPTEAKRAGLQASRSRMDRTVGAAVAQWLVLDLPKLSSPKYAVQKQARLDQVLDFVPQGRRPLRKHAVEAVRVEDVTTAMRTLEATPETARRVLRDLEKAFDWARGAGWREAANPCSGVATALPRPVKGAHRAPGASDLPAVVKALQSMPAAPAGGILDYGALLTRLLLLTAARTGEVRLLQWAEVLDLEGKAPRIVVPAERMKRRIAWTIPLARQSVALLQQLRQCAEQHGMASEYVFHRYGFKGRGQMTSENAVNDALKRAGLHGQLVGHGLRKLFSTAAHSQWPYAGPNRDKAIEMALAHSVGVGVEATYNRSDYMPERRELAQWWADLLDRLAIDGGANVVGIGKGRKRAAS